MNIEYRTLMDGAIPKSSTERLGGTILENLALRRNENFDPTAAPLRRYQGYGTKFAAEKFC